MRNLLPMIGSVSAFYECFVALTACHFYALLLMDNLPICVSQDTPLHFAAEKGRIGTVVILLQHGAIEDTPSKVRIFISSF